MMFEPYGVDEEVARGFHGCQGPASLSVGFGGRVSSQEVLDHPILHHIGDEIFRFWRGELPGSFDLRYRVLRKDDPKRLNTSVIIKYQPRRFRNLNHLT